MTVGGVTSWSSELGGCAWVVNRRARGVERGAWVLSDLPGGRLRAVSTLCAVSLVPRRRVEERGGFLGGWCGDLQRPHASTPLECWRHGPKLELSRPQAGEARRNS